MDRGPPGLSAAPALVAPSTRYAGSYLEALREGFDFAAQPTPADDPIAAVERDFEGFIARLTNRSGTVVLPNGEVAPKVPFSVFWLALDDTFIGQLNLRHELNDHLLQEGGHVGYSIRPGLRRRGYGRLILRLGLLECRRLGLARVLVTCQDDNLASARIIEANGGRLANVVPDPWGRGARVRRYWIDLPVPAPAS